jgi:FlaA1/EpsC-like NDP-sugar epimerase
MSQGGQMSIRRFNRNLIAAMHDAVMAAASFQLAVWIRLGDGQMDLAHDYLRYGTALFTCICMTVFIAIRLYRGLWRYASMRDLITITKAVSLSILIFAVVMFVINRLEGIPRSVLFINWMLLLGMLGGPRFVYRALKDRSLSWSMSLHEKAKIPVLLLGATDNAERFIRDMTRDAEALYQPVAIVDEDLNHKGRTIHHVPIYSRSLPKIVSKLTTQGQRPQKIILTDPRISGEAVQKLLEISDSLGIPLARLPKSGEMRIGLSDKPDVQPIAVEDVLGRAQNVLDRGSMQRLIEGETVLVTGAGGTIGGELSRQIAGFKPTQLILLDAAEFNLYQIDREMRAVYPTLPIHTVLGDVRDPKHIAHLFESYKPTLIFHAAAIKHVPLSEINVEEAILTNVFGTINVAEACREYGSKAMVMISTDKAVNPTNVMGASKRLAETACQLLGEDRKSDTQYLTVRFGNVLGSTGSVVPLFQEQLAKGGPITVTHPEMTRYFMTVREAVELVLQAATLGVGMKDRRECIFVLDMGKPVKIVDLARQMIRLAGMTPDEDIDIVFTGLRPGEKLYEELFYSNENLAKTAHESITLAAPKHADIKLLRTGMEKLLAACRERDNVEARRLLKTLVPEFTPAENDERKRA